MRTIKYLQTDLGGETEVEGSLLEFAYDVPHFAICQILPPLAVLNSVLVRGEAGGGMGPGTIWTPFQIDDAEYRELVLALREADPSRLTGRSRFISLKMEIDHELEDFVDFLDWGRAVSRKHKESFHPRIRAVEESRGGSV